MNLHSPGILLNTVPIQSVSVIFYLIYVTKDFCVFINVTFKQ